MGIERINFAKGLNMDLACANDETRPVMNCVHFENGFAYASDGHILVRNKIEECALLNDSQIEMLNGKNLHRDSYKQLIKYDTIIVSEDGIEAKKNGQTAFFYFDKTETKYPNAEAAIQNALNNPSAPMSQIGINTTYLIKLNKALFNSSACRYQFTGENSAIILQSLDSDSLGIIMPYQIMK